LQPQGGIFDGDGLVTAPEESDESKDRQEKGWHVLRWFVRNRFQAKLLRAGAIMANDRSTTRSTQSFIGWIRSEVRTRAPRDRKRNHRAEVRILISPIEFAEATQPQHRYPGPMDMNKMLAELRAEREQISEAIVVLERLAAGQRKRSGRPPKWMVAVERRGRPKESKNK
jgi:hypothetical protein